MPNSLCNIKAKTPDQSSIEWLLKQADKNQQLSHKDLAVAFYLEAIELDKNQPEHIYLNLIDLMNQVGYLKESREWYQKAIELYPESIKIHQLAQNFVVSSQKDELYLQDLVREKQQQQQLEINQQIEQLSITGPQKYQQGDLPGALTCYQKVISLNQNSPEWIYASAITIAAKLSRIDEALTLGEQALKLYPNHDEIHRSIGIAFEFQGDLENTIRHYNTAIKLNPQQPDWVKIKLTDHLESMSLKKRQQGDISTAKKLFDKSTKVKQQTQHSTDHNSLLGFQESISTENKLTGAIVSWDMSHNPAGRAYLLADMAKIHFDVELIGPIFTFYGQDIWSPIKNQDLEMRVFSSSDFTDFIRGAIELAKSKKYDFVYVSKPRFPSLFIGMLIKYYSQCPLILDVDDHELSFFKNQPLAEFAELIGSPRDEHWYKPYSEIWTRFSESLIPTADALTVSNIALQQRFGGVIVRHARNENIFDPQLYNRIDVRSQFGYQESDRVILFLGTPRPHKGIFQIAQALDNLNDPRLVLCVIGTIDDKRVAQKFTEYQNARIDFHHNQPWERLPELVSMADLICVLQDSSSPIADYQIPAKLTDAMAMGIPTMVTKVAPLQDLIASKSVIAIEDNLETAIADFFNTKDRQILQHSRERYTYIGEFTYGVNAERIKQTLIKAQKNYQPFPEIYKQIFQLITQESGISILDEQLAKPLKIVASQETKIKFKPDEPLNILFFWKQNDSDLYGRRQDMIIKYLANSDRINKIIHFDAPISASKLQEMVEHGPKAKFSQNNLVFTNTVDRFLGLKDSSKIIKRTFIYRDHSSGENFLGKVLPQKSDYPNFVRQVIQEAGIGKNTIAWVCPVSFEFPELHRELNFGCVVADIIDDQRQWDVKPQYLERLSENYQQILQNADLVFTNCDPVKQSFVGLNSQIEIVPNGSEIFDQDHHWSKPEVLNNLSGPIIGYVGNLSDRIDIELFKYIATNNPDWNIVIIGSAHGSAQIFELVKYENIHLLGVKPYQEAIQYIKNFDVGIIPHINNKLTKNMNPLKLYVYFAIGIPIVATSIPNIDEFRESIYIADNKEKFEQGIKQFLQEGSPNLSITQREKLLSTIDWKNRVENILSKIDTHLNKRNLSHNSNQFDLTKTIQNRSTDNSAKKSHKQQNLIKMNQPNSLTASLKIQESYDGICNLCGTKQTFVKEHRSLREGYRCHKCKASLRYRGQVDGILKAFGNDQYQDLANLSQDANFRTLSIYEPGVIGPFRKYFANFSNYFNSYFWSDVPLGDYQDGLQCQNLESLTYEDNKFDLIITSDIFEHIRHPWNAFQEIWRVLKPGGYHILSIPAQIPMRSETLYRVDTSGDEDIFLVEKRYHSAPRPGGGRDECLVYVDFGQDIIERLVNIGYKVELLSPNVAKSCDAHRLITFVTQKI